VDSDRRTHSFLDFGYSRARRYTAWKVRYIRRTVGESSFDYDSVSHNAHFRPACLRMLFSVLGASSSLPWPETVTRPDFDGCLYCRCPPLDRTRRQPFCSIREITSRIFIGREWQLMHQSEGALKSTGCVEQNRSKRNSEGGMCGQVATNADIYIL
jgi:hypothetical protein